MFEGAHTVTSFGINSTVDDQNWHDWAYRSDQYAQTGQTGLGDFVKMWI